MVEYDEHMSLTDDDKQWIQGILSEKLEAVETRLLTAFHDGASPRDARQQSHSAVLRALDLEVEDLRHRVQKLESRPQA
jgi:hypothetical protein